MPLIEEKANNPMTGKQLAFLTLGIIGGLVILGLILHFGFGVNIKSN